MFQRSAHSPNRAVTVRCYCRPAVSADLRRPPSVSFWFAECLSPLAHHVPWWMNTEVIPGVVHEVHSKERVISNSNFFHSSAFGDVVDAWLRLPQWVTNS
jgi:hypothetical protein